MAKEDWGIVVGVGVYPGLSNLDGPENDASAFYDWLVAPDGGAVPPEQVARILSSQFQPPAATARDAEPTNLRVQYAFEDLQGVADANAKAGRPRRVGRRLYVYLSGHGCAPRFGDAALLTANATQLHAGYHILGKLYANWFLRSNFFDQAVLFMDCCRESYPQVPPSLPPWSDITGTDAVDKTRSFYGFGTKWSRLSRERVMEDGKVHGIFTWALMKGLQGAACDPATGQINATTVGNYLYNNMKTFLTPDDLADPDVPKEPDLEYDNNPNNPIVLATLGAVPRYSVTINLPANAAGKRVQVLDSKLQLVDSVSAASPAWQLQLTRGTYLAQVLELGLQTPAFEVTGTGAVNVSF
jgi:hypothetical protein